MRWKEFKVWHMCVMSLFHRNTARCFFPSHSKNYSKENESKCIRLDASDSFVHQFEWIFELIFAQVNGYHLFQKSPSVCGCIHSIVQIYFFEAALFVLTRSDKKYEKFVWLNKYQANSTIICWIYCFWIILAKGYTFRTALELYLWNNWVTSI